MAGEIFLLQSDDKLVEMKEQPYDSEVLLQELLAKYPNLLAGDQMNSTVPRRWILVSREAALPSEMDGSARWSVDHLFLDQDAVPTIVEVKRSSDTRIRREVVGQMLEYAANATTYWPIEELQRKLDETCQKEGFNPEEKLLELIGGTAQVEDYWQSVKTNLKAGKVRMVFVADEIPTELQRIVEFLNGQMDPAEVLGVEVRQYVNERGKLKTLVPRLIGQTAEARDRKAGPRGVVRQWDEPTFFEELGKRGEIEVEVARRILKWSLENTSNVFWGNGEKIGSFWPIFEHDGDSNWLFFVYTYGRVEIQFQMMKSKCPFSSREKRLELLERLNTAVPGANISDDKADLRPSLLLSTVRDEAVLQQFLGVFDWYISQIKSS